MIRANIIILAFVLVLSGCKAAPQVTYDRHTGDTVALSESLEVESGLLRSLHVRAGHSAKAGYFLKTYYLNTGLGWAFLEQAWSYGKKYPFVVEDREVLSCGSGCSIRENGRIIMTRDQFERASKEGFTFALIGKRGRIEGAAPSRIFGQVLSLMNKSADEDRADRKDAADKSR